MNDFFKIADKYLKPVTTGAGVVLGLAVTYAAVKYLSLSFGADVKAQSSTVYHILFSVLLRLYSLRRVRSRQEQTLNTIRTTQR